MNYLSDDYHSCQSPTKPSRKISNDRLLSGVVLPSTPLSGCNAFDCKSAPSSASNPYIELATATPQQQQTVPRPLRRSDRSAGSAGVGSLSLPFAPVSPMPSPSKLSFSPRMPARRTCKANKSCDDVTSSSHSIQEDHSSSSSSDNNYSSPIRLSQRRSLVNRQTRSMDDVLLSPMEFACPKVEEAAALLLQSPPRRPRRSVDPCQ